VKESTDLGVFGQLVVERNGSTRFFYVHGNAAVAQKSERFGTGAEYELHAAREHDDLAAAIEQLEDVRGLNAWHVSRPGFVPIPWPAASGIELEVFARSESLNFHPPP
jgi:hypothetical protein